MSQADIQRQITLHQRRLQKLKEQQAIQGISTDPGVLLEIEDIEAKIAALKKELIAASEPTATAQAGRPVLSESQQRRLADLQRNIEQDYDLLKEYEDVLRLEDDPRRRMRYRREIERQKAAITGYEAELAEILPQAATQTVPDPIQQTLTAMQTQIAAMEERLAAGQQDLSQQLSQQQRTLLDHIEAQHRQTLQAVTTHLKADQLETVELLYDLVDQQQLAQLDLNEISTLVQRSLARLKDAPNAAYWQQLLAAAEGSRAVDQKAKLILPLIPCLLEYELELRADTLPALQQVWTKLREKIRR